MKRIIHITYQFGEKFLQGLLLGSLCFLFFTKTSAPTAIKLPFQLFTVTSGSMEPKIPTGSLALVTRREVNEIRIGDVIAFISPQDKKTTILHRITAIDHQNQQLFFQTKGDNNNAADNWSVSATAISGKLVFSVPYFGYGATFLRTKVGFILIVAIPMLYLSFVHIMKILEGIQEEIAHHTNKRLDHHDLRTGWVSAFFGSLGISFCIASVGIMAIYGSFTSQAVASGGLFQTLAEFPLPSASPLPSPSVSPFPSASPVGCSGRQTTETVANITVQINGNTGNNVGSGTTGDVNSQTHISVTGGENNCEN